MIFSYHMYDHIFKCLYNFHLLNAPLSENLLKKGFKPLKLKIKLLQKCVWLKNTVKPCPCWIFYIFLFKKYVKVEINYLYIQAFFDFILSHAKAGEKI